MIQDFIVWFLGPDVTKLLTITIGLIFLVNLARFAARD